LRRTFRPYLKYFLTVKVLADFLNEIFCKHKEFKWILKKNIFRYVTALEREEGKLGISKGLRMQKATTDVNHMLEKKWQKNL